MSTYITPYQIKEELVVFLRNQDLISISTRGVTTTTDNEGVSGTSYTLAVEPTLVKNVRYVRIGSDPELKFGSDYTVNYTTGVITFAQSQAGISTIIYDHGSNDRIWPDYPQPYLKLSNFPRIAVDIISSQTAEGELGGGSNFTNYTISITVYDKSQKNVEDMIAALRQAIIANKKNFYYFDFITPTAMGPLVVSPFGENKIFQRNQDCQIIFVWEQP